MAAGCMGLGLFAALAGLVICGLLIACVETDNDWLKVAGMAIPALIMVILLVTGRQRPSAIGGYEIVKRRESLGMSQDELARCLNIKVTTLSRWEKGEARIPRWLPSHLDMLEDLGPRD